jgi:hypothetical protein
VLELPGVGERPGSSRPSGNAEGGGPDILFLSEKKMDKRRLEIFRWKLGMTNFMVKNCEGQSGGLAVFWKTGVKVHFHTTARLYMHMDVEESDGFVWRFTGV